MTWTAMSDSEILAIADPLMATLMEGSRRIDHAMHTRDFTDRLKKIVTPERLQDMCKDYQARIGFFTEREFVALFRREKSVAVVWRQYSSKTSDEYVAEIVIVEQDGRYLVDHAMIF